MMYTNAYIWCIHRSIMDGREPTLEERIAITDAHWTATKRWIESGWTDQKAHDDMERLRQVMMGWSK